MGGSTKALKSFLVTFHGESAHASGSPYKGRSAADAMFLSFNGIEFMREHVKDGTRMHYTVKEALGPSNVVPQIAKALYTLRYSGNEYLEELEARFRKIIQGACLMTETEAEIQTNTHYAARKGNNTLAEVARQNLELMGVTIKKELVFDSPGSTDFANVSLIVPSSMIFLPYVNGAAHSQEWVDGGKTEHAKTCVINSAKVLAGVMYDIVTDPGLVEKAKSEFAET